MTQCQQQLAAGYKIRMTCVDIQRRPSVDLARRKERRKLLARIQAKEFDAILLSPPCSTFSRAPWANFKGPRPVRSAAKPRGLDQLTAAERGRCILGNIFADLTWEVVELAIAVNVSFLLFLLLEQPEDLGRLATGPYKGQRPASMWQWPAMSKVAKLPKVATLALHQRSFGTSCPKPTRLLLLGVRHCPDFCHVGPPTYDDEGSYMGPLPRLQGQPSMRERELPQGALKPQGQSSGRYACVSGLRLCYWILVQQLLRLLAMGKTLTRRWRIAKIAIQFVSQKVIGYKGEKAP